MWRLPASAVAWMLVCHGGLVAWALMAGSADHRPRQNGLRFTVFVATVLLHLWWTDEADERRRAALSMTEYVDQTSVFLMPAALVLPVNQFLLLICLVRLVRWTIARRPAVTFLFSSTAIGLSALGVHAVAVQASPLNAWLTGQRPWPTTTIGWGVVMGSLAAAVAVYFAGQAILIGVARGLMDGQWSLRELIGDQRSNLLIVTTLLLAVCSGVVQAVFPPLMLLAAPVTARWTSAEQGALRTRQQLREVIVDRDQQRHVAEHDQLTGLLNRRGFEPKAQAVVAAGSAAVLMCDIDHFKAWNDRLGHEAGDQILTAVGQGLWSGTRHDDVVGRWGGEEFCVVLADSGVRDALAAAEKIRQRVAAMRTEVTAPAGGQIDRVNGRVEVRGTVVHLDRGCTMSIGVAVSPQHGSTLAELQRSADQALRAAKEAGRDRVVLAAEPDTEEMGTQASSGAVRACAHHVAPRTRPSFPGVVA